MAHGRARDERKERLWRRWIGEWQTSGLSARAFCQRRGLTVASFYAWRRVLQRRDAEKAAFVPVQVVADPVPTQAGALEVVLTDGRTVRVSPGFDANTPTQMRLLPCKRRHRSRETIPRPACAFGSWTMEPRPATCPCLRASGRA